MDADIKGYSQWFAGKSNNVADALSWDWHQDDAELTSILRFYFPQQMPQNFQISPLPSEISSWLISLLQQLPMKEQLREQHTAAGLMPGSNGSNGAGQSDATTSTSTILTQSSKTSCSEHL